MQLRHTLDLPEMAGGIGFSGDILGINTVLAAMPVGTYGAMFCLQYGKDETVMVQGILISTLLSILSIPLITQIL